MRAISHIILSLALPALTACEWSLRIPGMEEEPDVTVARLDRLESQYLSTGDFSALQQMETDFPMETKTLIEHVLHIGLVEDPDINSKFLSFFQDSTLQSLIADTESEYANMDDINDQMAKAFANLKKEMPETALPKVYAQIGALDQSIVIGENTIGISLDKYLGENYPLYSKYYRLDQRKTMSRENIVPDCLSFYLLSLYPLSGFDARTQQERDIHTGKVMWVTNQMTGTDFFKNKYVDIVSRYMADHPGMSIEELLTTDNCAELAD